MPTRRVDRQPAGKGRSRGAPKRNPKTRGGSLEGVKATQKRAARGAAKGSPQQAVENLAVGRGTPEDYLTKQPGSAGGAKWNEKPITAQRPPMPNESSRTDQNRRGGRKRN